MFKKLIIVSAILAASTSLAFAGQSYKGEKDYKGEMAAPCPTYTFATGPYVGLSIGDRTNYTGTPVVFRGIDGNLSLGYGALVNPAFYLAGELFGIGTINVKDLQNSNVTPTVSAKSNWSWGGSLIPGYMITDYVLAYVRLGGQSTHFNGVNVNQSKGGRHVGLGGETQIVQNWDLRGEYIYSRYGSLNNIGVVSSNTANIGVVYKFL